MRFALQAITRCTDRYGSCVALVRWSPVIPILDERATRHAGLAWRERKLAVAQAA